MINNVLRRMGPVVVGFVMLTLFVTFGKCARFKLVVKGGNFLNILFYIHSSLKLMSNNKMLT